MAQMLGKRREFFIRTYDDDAKRISLRSTESTPVSSTENIDSVWLGL